MTRLEQKRNNIVCERTLTKGIDWACAFYNVHVHAPFWGGASLWVKYYTEDNKTASGGTKYRWEYQQIDPRSINLGKDDWAFLKGNFPNDN